VRRFSYPRCIQDFMMELENNFNMFINEYKMTLIFATTKIRGREENYAKANDDRYLCFPQFSEAEKDNY
jgi:hypothetical protein